MNKSIHQRCAFGIINCIRTLWQEQDLQDFNFQVDDTLFHCHRVLLGACSPVLRGMFKSGMKEDKEGLAKLQDISKETFQLILTILYTGRDVLTVDNIIDIWKAAHMLQIDFLVKHCEKCAIKFIKIENFHEFNEKAQLFGSETVLKVSRKFILKNFNAVRKTRGFLKMSSNELLSIVKRQDLVVSSEDIVLEAIIDWADYYKDEPVTKQSLDVNGSKYERGSGDHEKAEVRIVGTVNTEGSEDHKQADNARSVGTVNTEGSEDPKQAGNVRSIRTANNEGSEDHKQAGNVRSIRTANNEGSEDHKQVDNVKSVGTVNTEGSEDHKQADNVRSVGTVNTEGSEDHKQAGNVRSIRTANNEGSEDHKQVDNVKSVGTVNTEGSDVNHQKEERRDKTREDDHKENDTLTRSQTHAVHRKSRLERLTYLLKASRLCLASSLFLKTLYKHELVQSKYRAKNIIFTAITYQLSTCWHGQWPSTAIHRECSDFDNFGVYVTSKTEIEALSFGKEKWVILKCCSNLDKIFRLDSYNNELYAFGKKCNRSSYILYICRFDGNEWRSPITVPGQDTEAILVAHGYFMYILSNQAKKLYQFNPTDASINVMEFTPLPPDTTFECAFSIEMNILAFCDILVNGKHETRAYSLNIADSQWTQCGGFEGPAKHMISIRDDNDYYILQTGGSLRVVTVGINGAVGFTFLAKLWDFNKVLHGAVIYKDCLHIFGNDPGSDPKDKDVASFLAGRFKDIIYWGDDDATSNFVPATLRKSQEGNT